MDAFDKYAIGEDEYSALFNDGLIFYTIWPYEGVWFAALKCGDEWVDIEGIHFRYGFMLVDLQDKRRLVFHSCAEWEESGFELISSDAELDNAFDALKQGARPWAAILDVYEKEDGECKKVCHEVHFCYEDGPSFYVEKPKDSMRENQWALLRISWIPGDTDEYRKAWADLVAWRNKMGDAEHWPDKLSTDHIW